MLKKHSLSIKKKNLCNFTLLNSVFSTFVAISMIFNIPSSLKKDCIFLFYFNVYSEIFYELSFFAVSASYVLLLKDTRCKKIPLLMTFHSI